MSSKKIELLKLAFRFRFITTPLLAEIEGQQNHSASLLRLNTLVKEGLLRRRYEKNYHLEGRPAEYYLSPQALPVLSSILKDPSVREFKQIYERPKRSGRYINRALFMLKLDIFFRKIYGDRYKLLTKPELTAPQYAYLPDPTPDAMISIRTDEGNELFFVEYFDDAIAIGLHMRKIERYIDFYESGMWQRDASFPRLLIICESDDGLRRTCSRIRRMKNGSDSSIEILVTTWRRRSKFGVTSWIDPMVMDEVAI